MHLQLCVKSGITGLAVEMIDPSVPRICWKLERVPHPTASGCLLPVAVLPERSLPFHMEVREERAPKKGQGKQHAISRGSAPPNSAPEHHPPVVGTC